MDFARRAVESEQALIGAAMLQNDWLPDCDIRPDEFLNRDHREVWVAISELVKDRQPVDLVTLDALMKRKGFNWTAFLADLGRNTPSAANWRAYANALRKYSQLERTSQVLAEARKKLEKGEQVADYTIGRLMALDLDEGESECDTKAMMLSAINLLDARRKGEIKAIPTGIKELDKMIGGLHDSDLVVIAGRPAMGKTAVMLNIAANVGVPAGLISTEQPREQIGMRLLSIRGDLPVERMRTADLTEPEYDRLTAVMTEFSTSNAIRINDRAFMTVLDVARQARRWKHRYGLKVLFVDYIQRIKGGDPRAPKHERVGEVVRGLKDIARELAIPVVALAQVSRDVENRNNKRPTMADISDSSEIEKEADQVITLYRDEVYNPDSMDRGILELNICKNRHGATGGARAVWRGEYMQVRDIARQP